MSLCSNVICGAVSSFVKIVFGKNCFGNYLVKPNFGNCFHTEPFCNYFIIGFYK